MVIASKNCSGIDSLLLKNEEYITEYCQAEAFSIFTDNTLKSAEKRKVFFSALQIFSSYFQTTIFSRQATCVSERYRQVFLEHFLEELGHDELLPANGEKEQKDAVLVALSSWFSHQMLIRDNVEKTLMMHLVIEPAGDHYHHAASKELANDSHKEYFSLHAEVDHGHQELGIPLLYGHTEDTYRELLTLLHTSWSVMIAVVNRIAYLAHRA